MKEKIGNAMVLIGEIKDGIDHDHEEAQEIVNNILDSLDELEFLLEDEKC